MVFDIAVLAARTFVEVQGVTERIVLVLGILAGASVPVESPNKGLPPRSGDDLGPLTELLEGPEAARPPAILGENGRVGVGVRPGCGSHALPPCEADGVRRARAEAGEAEAAACVGYETVGFPLAGGFMIDVGHIRRLT